jgi:hypothetical protein
VLITNERALVVNSDTATLWNFRRRVVSEALAAWCAAGGAVYCMRRWRVMSVARGGGDGRRSVDSVGAVPICERELALTQRIIADVHPKSYGAWHHRRWVVATCAAGCRLPPSRLPACLPAGALNDGASGGVWGVMCVRLRDGAVGTCQSRRS